jgi:hypothetical protein
VAPTAQKPATTAKAPEKGRTATAPVQQKPAAATPAGQGARHAHADHKAAERKAAATATTSQGARAGIGQFDTLSPLKPPVANPTNSMIAGRR